MDNALNAKRNSHNRNGMVFLISFILLSIINYNLDEVRYFVALPLAAIVFFYFLFLSEFKVNLNITKKYFIIIFLATLLGIASDFEILSYNKNLNYGLLDYLFSIWVKITVSYIVIVLSIKLNVLEKILSTVILVNISFFAFQFFLVYTTNIYPDFLDFLIGEKQRYGSRIVIPIIGELYRPTGFYEEPSTYSSIILVLLATRYYVSNKFDYVFYFAVATMVMSLSVAFVIIGLGIGLGLLLNSKKTYLRYLPFLLFPIVCYALYLVASIRLDSVGNATDLRGNLMLEVFKQPWFSILFGNGLFGVLDSLKHYVQEGTLWKAGVVTLNDNGLWLFLIIKIGFIGLFLTILFFYKKLDNRICFVLFLLVLLTKVSFLYFVFIFYVCVVFFIEPYNPKI